MKTPSTHEWFKSSYSGGSGTECVECALVDSGILVRDSKRGSGPIVTLGKDAWCAFLSGVPELER